MDREPLGARLVSERVTMAEVSRREVPVIRYGGGVPGVTPKAAYRRWRLQGVCLWAAAILLWLAVLGAAAAIGFGVYLATQYTSTQTPCQNTLGGCP